MGRLSISEIAFVIVLAILSGLTSTSSAGLRPNVLIIAVDDLRPESGCYGASHIHSPNIDALAATGRLFRRAYCQQAVCSPSRTSLMSGLRPDSIGVTGNHSHFHSSKHPGVVTLPQHLKKHGYHVAAIGKIDDGEFREGASINRWDTLGDRESWSVPAIRYGPRYYYTEEGIAAAKAPSIRKSISFEMAKPGPFEKLDTEIGTWTPVVGQSIVDDKHARTGKQCLQLTGGDKTSVTIRIAEKVDTSGMLSFWAERWTVRQPFLFRIEKQTGSGWREIYNGDAEVRVGRAFLNHVKIPLGDSGIQQLRFTCSSPPNTGILLDDLRIAPSLPQKINSVEVVPFTLPVLVGAPASPLAKLKITTTGDLNPISLMGVTATLHSTADQAAIESVSISTQPGGLPDPSAKVVDASDWKARGTKEIKASLKLVEGANIVWVNCRLKKDANIDQQIGATISRVVFLNETIDLDVAAPSMQRLGVAVRKRGDDGVHTYRIPGLATTNKGTLIGVCDVRRRGSGDLPGDIDVGMSRSTDRGKTWQPMKIIMDMGRDPTWRYDGIGDPSVLVDKNTGTIWVAATWSHGNRSWRGSGPGLKPEETGQLMLVRSDDDGVTWSKPINITEQVKKPEWCFLLQGPGKGITMRDGTIVFAAQYQDPPEQQRLPHSTIIYSKDHGRTWLVGTGAFDDTTESQVVEIEPGVLMLNCRYNQKSVRVVMTTRDMGKTWQKHMTSERALIEPGACMASLINVDQEVGKETGGWLLFSNPDSTRGRNHITIKASPDAGLTWPKQHRLLLDEGNSAGYSCMTMIDEQNVGILYEGSQAQMTFQQVPLSELINRKLVGQSSANRDSCGTPGPSL